MQTITAVSKVNVQNRFKFSCVSSGKLGASTEFGNFPTASGGGQLGLGRGGVIHGHAGGSGGKREDKLDE